DDLGSSRVERADHRQRENSVPKLDHRRRQFQEVCLLTADDFFAGRLKCLDRVQAKLVQKLGGRPQDIGEFGNVAAAAFFLERLKQWALQGEDKGGGLVGRETCQYALARQVLQERPYRKPSRAADIGDVIALCGVGQ